MIFILILEIKQKNKKHHKLLSQKFKLNKRLKPPLGLSKLALANGRGNGINGDILNNFDGSSDLHSGLTSRSKTGSPLPPFNRERWDFLTEASMTFDLTNNIILDYPVPVICERVETTILTTSWYHTASPLLLAWRFCPIKKFQHQSNFNN